MDEEPQVSVKSLLQQLEQRKQKSGDSNRPISKLTSSVKSQSPRQAPHTISNKEPGPAAAFTPARDILKKSLVTEAANSKYVASRGSVAATESRHMPNNQNVVEQTQPDPQRLRPAEAPSAQLSSIQTIFSLGSDDRSVPKAHVEIEKTKSEAEIAKNEAIALRRQVFLQSESNLGVKLGPRPDGPTSSQNLEAEQIQAQLRSTQEELSELKSNLARLQSHHENVCKACVDLQSKTTSLTAQLQESSVRLQSKEQELDHLRRNYEARIKKLTADLEAKPAELEDLKQQLRAVALRRLEDADRHAEAQRAAARFHSEAEAARDGLEQARAELAQAHAELRVAKSQTADVLLETVRERDREILDLQKRLGELEIQQLARPDAPDLSLDLKMKEMEVRARDLLARITRRGPHPRSRCLSAAIT